MRVLNVEAHRFLGIPATPPTNLFVRLDIGFVSAINEDLYFSQRVVPDHPPENPKSASALDQGHPDTPRRAI
jgi:hypothetical protein